MLNDDQIFLLADASPKLRAWIRRVHKGIEEYFPLPDQTSITATKIIREWKVYDAARRRFERMWAPRFITVFEAAGAQAAQAYRGNPSLAAVDTVIEQSLVPKLLQLLPAVQADVGVAFARRAETSIRRKDDFDVVDMEDLPEMRDYFSRATGSKVTKIADTTRNSVRAAVERGIRDGDSIDDIASELQRVGGFSKMRAYVIARTEVIQASNAGTHFSIKRFVNTTGMSKSWLATNDRRTRPTHVKAGATQKDIPYEEPFQVGGSLLLFPGDGSLGAAAREIINCFPAETTVSTPTLYGAYRRHYEGSLVVVKLSNGEELSGTPNHPALTPQGWRALQLLQKDDKLLRYSFAKGAATGKPNVDRNNPTIQEVYDSFALSNDSERIRGRSVDFHGDGSDEQVSIVSAYGRLSADNETRSDELFLKTPFFEANILKRALTENSASVRALLRKRTPGGIVRSARYALTLLLGKLFHPKFVSFRDATPGSPRPLQAADNALMHGSELAREFFQRGATKVTVADVSIKSFSGFVYNLHSSLGYYAASGYVVANCRCTALYYAAPPSTPTPPPPPPTLPPPPKPPRTPKPRTPKPPATPGSKPIPKPQRTADPSLLRERFLKQTAAAEERLAYLSSENDRLWSRISSLAEGRTSSELAALPEYQALDALLEKTRDELFKLRSDRLLAYRNLFLEYASSDAKGDIKYTLKMRGLSDQEKANLKAAVKFVNSLTGGIAELEGVKIEVLLAPDGRAFQKTTVKFNPKTLSYENVHQIYIKRNEDPATIVHEIAHAVERMTPRVYEAVNALWDKRTTGEAFQKLRDVTGLRGYAETELTKTDRWIDAYMGKVYRGADAAKGLTELTSMSLELMFRDPTKLMTQDPELFDVIFRALQRP